MALFSLDIEKELLGESWTNRYIIQSPDITTALLTANAIWPLEQAVHADNVTFTRYRVSDNTPGTDVFIIVPIGEQGAVSVADNGDYLPLFNVVRVDFPAGVGRPSRKYLRCPVFETHQSAGVFTPAYVAFINSAYGTPLGDIDEFVDVDGEPLGTGICQPKVGMRQLRRGSKRRATPVLG